jgi:S1-C subfamily serine protease
VLIADVKGGGRAEKDGLQRGDIVVEISGEKIPDVTAMKNALASIKNSVKIKIFRQGSFSLLTLNPAN